jgi:respiratory burst oxidase
MDRPIDTAREDFTPLTGEEINAFFDDIDKDSNGYVTFEELEAKLHKVHEELAPEPKKHHLHHPARRDLEKGNGHAGDGLHAFLSSLLPESSLGREDFIKRVQSWQVPSQKHTDSQEHDHEDLSYERRMPWRRRVRAYVSILMGKTLTCLRHLLTLFPIAFSGPFTDL